MIKQLALYPIFGLPAIMYGGAGALFFVFAAGTVAFLGTRGLIKNHYKIHVFLARIALVLGLIHGLAGILIFIS